MDARRTVLAVLVFIGAGPAQDARLGSELEIRSLAWSDDHADGVRFELPGEQIRLEAWLSVQDHRDAVRLSPAGIREFNWLTVDEGGPLNPWIQWYPLVIHPDQDRAGSWSFSFARGSQEVPAVALFTDEEWNDGVPDRDGPAFLVEFLPLNLHCGYFTESDLEPALVRAEVEPPDIGIAYSISADRLEDFEAWRSRQLGRSVPFIFDGIVLAAPVLAWDRRGEGLIRLGFRPEQIDNLARSLQTTIQRNPDRCSAAELGLRRAPGDPGNIPVYAVHLSHPDPDLRHRAAVLLGWFGERAAPAVPSLIRALQDDEVHVVLAAMAALGSIGPAASDAIAPLEQLAEHPDERVARRAESTLRRISQ